MKNLYLILLLILIGCSEPTKEEQLRSKSWDIHKTQVKTKCTSQIYGSFCKISFNGKESCYSDRGQRSVAISCSLYNEMEKILDGLDNK
ncbi:hypothetical protein N9948_02005 [bacterium]|nr:hypothetical protein [bacterium]